jgi:hypothetical protein
MRLFHPQGRLDELKLFGPANKFPALGSRQPAGQEQIALGRERQSRHTIFHGGRTDNGKGQKRAVPDHCIRY